MGEGREARSSSALLQQSLLVVARKNETGRSRRWVLGPASASTTLRALGWVSLLLSGPVSSSSRGRKLGL